jgi:2',3'-cyclic-nucleotide 2'-phosphodiesterase
MKTIRVLCIGDVVGATGRSMFQKHIDRVRKAHSIDAIIVNGENSAGGRGITSRIAKFFVHNGANVITTGNHIWQKKEVYSYLNESANLLRPANYPSGCPGKGVTTFACGPYVIGVMNLQGRVFMKDHIDCPFRSAESALSFLRTKTPIIIVDFHAEASSEKMAMGHFLDGKVSAVVGTHTHVQTADERVLPGGTAFMSDLGMTGSLNGMLGMQRDAIMQNFLNQLPVKFKVSTESPVIMTGAWIEIDPVTGHALKIERVRIVDGELSVSEEEDDR